MHVHMLTQSFYTSLFWEQYCITPTWGKKLRVSQHRLGCDFLNMLRHKGEKTWKRTTSDSIDKQPWNESNILSHQFCCKDLTIIFFKIGFTNDQHIFKSTINTQQQCSILIYPIWNSAIFVNSCSCVHITGSQIDFDISFTKTADHLRAVESMYVTKVRGEEKWKNISLQCVHLHVYKECDHGCIFNISYVSTPFLRTTYAYRIASSVWKSLTSHQAQIRTSQLYKKWKQNTPT